MTSQGSQTLERGLHVLDILTDHRTPLRLGEIAEATGLNISTVSRLLTSLERRGYVRRDQITGSYRLGYKLLHMAQIVQEQAGLHELADPVLQELVDATNETATLGILQEDHAMVIARVACSNQLRIAAPIGTRVPLFCTAAGKSLLAHLPEEEVERILALGMPALTPLTITSPQAMRQELETIRGRGYSLDRGEREIGLIGISSPVRDVWGKVIATCGISGSEQRMQPDRVPELAGHVMAAATELSKRIGWQPSGQSTVLPRRSNGRRRSMAD